MMFVLNNRTLIVLISFGTVSEFDNEILLQDVSVRF
jgi:hypothetical protein